MFWNFVVLEGGRITWKGTCWVMNVEYNFVCFLLRIVECIYFVGISFVFGLFEIIVWVQNYKNILIFNEEFQEYYFLFLQNLDRKFKFNSIKTFTFEVCSSSLT